ncbi:uncharacterized protein LOC112573679 [Pomacea canaliculata]|nr:uncharacterized protein LOC112573679 [Pomacea canaliculata]
MASLKRGSDEDSEGTVCKMSRKDDNTDDDGPRSKTGRIRKKSAKVLEMEEFEEAEKKQFTKKSDTKGKITAVPVMSGSSAKKSKIKFVMEEPGMPGSAAITAVPNETFAPNIILQSPVASDSVSLSPLKSGSKQAVATKIRDGQGSVIKLLLSSPAMPTPPSVTTSVLTKTSPPTTVNAADVGTPAHAIPSKKSVPKLKTEPLIKQEIGLPAHTEGTSFLKVEPMETSQTHLLLDTTLTQEMVRSPQINIKSEPGPPKNTSGSLKMKLMMSPKDSKTFESIFPTSVPIPNIFGSHDETDGEIDSAETNNAPKTKSGLKKKKSSIAGEKLQKQPKKHQTAAQQMPNLAALVTGGKARKAAVSTRMRYEGSSAPPEGDIAALAAKVQGSGISNDTAEAVELFLEQVAAVTTSNNNSDDHSRVKDKERDVKRASRMIIPPECKCHLNNGQPCHTRFSVGELMDTRMHYMTISKKELDIAVLAKLECGIHLSRMTTRKKRKPTERKKHRTDFYHHGYRICNLMFVYLHGFSYKKLKALVAQYKTNGVKTRIHKNLKPKPELEEKKSKKKKPKAKPRPKMSKKTSVQISKVDKTGLEQKKDRNPPQPHFLNISQHKSMPQPAVPHPPPPPPSAPVTFPLVSQNSHPHAPTFPIAAKHNPSPPFTHSAAGYSNNPMFPHHPSVSTGHPHHHHDYQNQRGMINPPLDFSNQRTNLSNFPVFPGSNPQETFANNINLIAGTTGKLQDLTCCPLGYQGGRSVVRWTEEECLMNGSGAKVNVQIKRNNLTSGSLLCMYFAQISRTLGVMWQCLSKKEKMMWRRKSKKLAGKGSTLISTGKGIKKDTSATVTAVTPTSGHQPATAKISSGGKTVKSGSTPAALSMEDAPLSPVKGFGIEPIDIAAHLKLLGESLSIIGMRLQEHKGLIAVQGSLSVLLDSLLCACGPLIALTQQIPGLDGCSESTHARTLDSVAYIMPGL